MAPQASAQFGMLVGYLVTMFGVPFALPPDKEDELLARIAPPAVLCYGSAAGTAALDPKSPNSTEQLLGSAEVQKMLALLDAQAEKTIAEIEATGGAQDAAVFRDMWKRAKFLVTRPHCLWIESASLRVSSSGDPELDSLKGAIVVNLGTMEGPAIRDLLTTNLKTLGPVENVAIGTYQFSRMSLPKFPAKVTWGLLGGQYLVIGFGDQAVEELIARARSAPPAWLTKLRTEMPLPRRSTIGYLDVLKFRALIAPMTQGAEEPFAAALGLDKVVAIEGVSGLDETGFVQRIRLTTAGAPAGVLSLFDAPPLTAADLADVPENATAAIVLKLDPAKAIDLAIATIDKLQPGAGTQGATQAFEGAKREIGFHLRDDVAKNLGPTWRLYSSPDDGPAIFTGATLVVDVVDPVALAKHIDAVVTKMMNDPIARQPGMPTIAKNPEMIPGVTFYQLTVPRAPPNMMPCWAVVGKKLVVTVNSATLKSFVGRTAQFASLAKNPRLAALLAGQPGRQHLMHLDMKQLAEGYGPLAQASLQQFLSQAHPDIDPAKLPQVANLAEFLQPMWSTVRYTPSGIEFESRSTLPGTNVVHSAPMTIAMLYPAVIAARTAARRMQDANNLKQIALGMHNYHSTFMRFPQGFSVDKQGKPLHSWRVYLLPYMEQTALYDRLKLDEPWDSAHNKPLLTSVMPDTYRSPFDPPGTMKTRYVTIRVPNSVFPGSDKIGIDQIIDGTANTLLVVAVSRDAAVEWYKPDDFVPDAKDPIAKLFDASLPGFNAAYADGSVHFLPKTIDAMTLKALISRDGKEVVQVP